MNVAFATDRRCVAKPRRYLFDCGAKVTFRLSGTVEALQFVESHCRQNCTGPGAKILRGDIRSGNFFKVVVHIGRGNVLAVTLLINVLQKLLTGQLLTSPYDLSYSPVLHPQ